MHSALMQSAVSVQRDDEHFLCTWRCPKACPQACPMACPQACVPAGVPAGVVCPKRRDTEEPDGRVVGPEGGMVRESMRDVPEGDTKEPEGGMVRESMRDVPGGDTEKPEGGMVRESMRDVPESDTEEPDGRHGTREHAEREIGRWARSPPPRMKRGRYRRSYLAAMIV